MPQRPQSRSSTTPKLTAAELPSTKRVRRLGAVSVLGAAVVIADAVAIVAAAVASAAAGAKRAGNNQILYSQGRDSFGGRALFHFTDRSIDRSIHLRAPWPSLRDNSATM